MVDQVGRRPAALHLAHFATQHVVGGLGVAAEVDAIDVSALAGVDAEDDLDRVVVVMHLGRAIDVGERIAFVAQATGDQLRGGGHQFARKHLALLHQQEGLELVLGDFQLATQLDVAHRVFLAFLDVHGDVDVFFVRGHGDLGRGDIHVDIATVQVIGAQPFEVAGEFLPRVFIVVLEKRQPVAGLECELVDQGVVGEYRIAHHVDVLDRRHLAFIDLDLHTHPIARLGHDLGFNRRRVTALGNVLALQLVAHAFKGCALENLAFGQARLLHAFHQIVGGDRLVALELDTGNRRTLDYIDNQHVAFAAQLDVLEEPGLEQRASGIHQAPVIGFVADVQRQCAEHAARRDPLQAVDSNIRDFETLGECQ